MLDTLCETHEVAVSLRFFIVSLLAINPCQFYWSIHGVSLTQNPPFMGSDQKPAGMTGKCLSKRNPPFSKGEVVGRNTVSNKTMLLCSPL